MADKATNPAPFDRFSFRTVMVGTAWVTGCLTLFANPVGLWPLVIYLALFNFHIRVVDEGHEAKRMARELRSWLT